MDQNKFSNKLNYKKLIVLGVLVWAVPYFIATIFVIYKIQGILPGVILVLSVAAASFLAGRELSFSSLKEIVKYSFGWVMVGIFMDLILTVPFTGLAIFRVWHVIIGYLLILLIPLLTIKNNA